MKLTLVQIEVTHSLPTNKNKILQMIKASEKGAWLLFPECALTGYFPDEENFLEAHRPEEIDQAIHEIAETAKKQQVVCLLGTARYKNNAWFNSVAIISPDGTLQYFDKIALSQLEKKHFAPGTSLDTYQVQGVTFGVLICRELVFPEMWQTLKAKGAQIVFHSNNAIKPYDAVWEHIVIARAVENQFFVASANNAAHPSNLASYFVEPSGNVQLASEKQVEQCISTEIDLAHFDSPY